MVPSSFGHGCCMVLWRRPFWCSPHFLQFSGSIKGATVSNALLKFVAWILAAATAVMFLIIWGYLFSWMFDPILFLFTGLWVGYGVYYTGMILPTIWALFSIKSGDISSDAGPEP